MNITPGPWEVVKRDSWKQIRGESGVTVICELCKPKEGDALDAARAEADARLIAAAPQLLELLRAAHPYIKAVNLRATQLMERITNLLQQIEKGEENNG